MSYLFYHIILTVFFSFHYLFINLFLFCCINFFRLYFANLTIPANTIFISGIAAIDIMCNNFGAAVEQYETIIKLNEEYKGKLSVDTLQVCIWLI